MKKKILLVLSVFLAFSIVCCKTNQKPKFNFDFEKVVSGMPEQWIVFGGDGYTLGVDSANTQNGKYSVFIEHKFDAEPNFKAWAMEIPGSYEGKQITFTGYIKTEGVSDGFAGLWLRIDPDVGLDNMQNRGVVGTTDWKQYSITLELDPPTTKQIVLGGLLVGNGKMWIDNLKVTIDDKDIQDLTPFVAKGHPAQKDKRFDNGSGISEIPINADNIKTLKQLGLIWGFLKYYHPAVAEGNYNWDYELFLIIPKVINEPNQAKRDKTIVEWINNLGRVTENTSSVEIKDEVKIQPDLGWIENSGFSKELTATLNRVKNAKRRDSNYYVGLLPGVNNPKFKNENAYENMKYPDMGFRILSLYRYWNMIQYYFPYKNLIEEDWKGVLEEFTSRFVNAQNELEYVLANLEIIARVHDTHANLWMDNAALNKFFGEYYALPALTFIEGKAVVTGFYNNELGNNCGLRIGDIITEIDGKKIEDIVKSKLKYTPASNYATQLRDLSRSLLRSNAENINITYTRNGNNENATLTTHSSKVVSPYNRPHPKSSFRLLDGNISYLYPGLLKPKEITKLWKDIKDTKGLIIDLRCYPSEFIVFSLGSKLVPQASPFVKFSSGNILTPGLFTMTKELLVGHNNSDYYKGKVVILINETTQSQAEYTAMSLRKAPSATVIGSTTAGADGNVSEILLPGGLRTMISGIGVYYPNGKETQRVGIVPDIELKPTVKGVLEGRDELLDKAIEVINR